MSNRFIDNETLLDAETLNEFEADLKFPVYNAVYDAALCASNTKVYRISDVEWSEIPVGSLFSVKFNESLQGNTGEYLQLKFGTSNETGSINVFYNNPDTPVNTSNFKMVSVSNRRYLAANRPYIMKKNVEQEHNASYITIVDQFDTAKFGSTLEVSGNTLQMKNLDGTAISNVTLTTNGVLPAATQNALGGVKIWITGTTLNISNT